MTNKAPIELPLRPKDLAEARRHFSARLASAIQNAGSMGDVGIVSGLVADIRALDFVGALNEDPAQPKPAPATPTKDADTLAVRKLAEQNAKKDADEAHRAEVLGEDAEPEAKIPRAERRAKA